MTAVEYSEFLKAKVDFDQTYGFPVYDDQLSPCLKGHQAAIVKWAVLGGRRAIFAAFGLGKSVMQLEVLRLIHHHEGGRQLIVCGRAVELNPGYFADAVRYCQAAELAANTPTLFDLLDLETAS